MLVLSRKKDESVMVGDVEIMICDVRGDKVRLGITAPRDIPVHRKEIYEAIQAEKEQGFKFGK
jgi:carbon storage regulator